MIWIHCGNADERGSTLSLVRRIQIQGDGARILVTAPDADWFADLPDGVDFREAPPDSPIEACTFLDHWAPRYLIWNGGPVRPVLLRKVADTTIPGVLINARTATLFSVGARWIPGTIRGTVGTFARIFTADGATATLLFRGGVSRDRVRTTGPVLEDPIALPYDPNELTVIVETLGTRPVWFAADVTKAEIAHIADAHVAASRKNHRLLLVLTPRDLADAQDVATTLRDAGLKVGVRSAGDDPLPEQQVYIADIEDEAGLWYRAVPLTFLGGTLDGGDAISPFEPIVLGSAIVHGPRKAPYDAQFERLAKVQANREIRSATELGVAVGTLISPEQTARMSLAGWTEITQSAETINALITDAVRDAEAEKAEP